MSQTTENLLPAVSGQDLGNSPSQEWDVFARDVSISGPINLVPSGEGEAGQVMTSGGAGNPAGWSSGGVNVVGGTGISVSTVGNTVTVTNTATATPASPDTSVQFNDGGAFGGSALLYDKAAKKLSSGDDALQLEWINSDGQNSVTFDAQAGLTGATVSVNSYGSASPTAFQGDVTAAGDGATAIGGNFTVRTRGADVTDKGALTGITTRVIFSQSANISAGGVGVDIGEPVSNGQVPAHMYGLSIGDQGQAAASGETSAIHIAAQTAAGTSNYGIKIGNIGLSGDNDYAIQTGWGKSQFGEDINLLVWPDDPTFSGLVNIPYVSHFVYGDASTNSNTVSHIHFYKATANSPGVILSSTAGTGAIPTIDIYGNTNHTYIDSGIFTIVNNSGVASTITTNNTGGDFPATGNSNGLQITAIGSGAGTFSGNALEVTGTGSDYEHSFGIQVNSASRALFTGGVQLSTSASRPTASATIRGTLWVAQGAAGVADKIQVVLKDAANAYAWHDVTFV